MPKVMSHQIIGAGIPMLAKARRYKELVELTNALNKERSMLKSELLPFVEESGDKVQLADVFLYIQRSSVREYVVKEHTRVELKVS